MIKLDSVAIMTKSVEAAISLYCDLFDCTTGGKAGQIFVDAGSDNQKFAFVRTADGRYIEFLEYGKGPHSQKEEGSLVELCFEVDDIAKFYDRMKNKGITLTDYDGRPIVDKNFTVTSSGNKIAWLPRDRTLGAWIYVLERAWH